MARSANQKLKLLYLCRILMEQTDEEHPLSESSPDSCVKCYTMFLPFLLIKIDVFS